MPVLVVTGEVDMTTSETVRDALSTCLNAATSALVLDLNEVTFLAVADHPFRLAPGHHGSSCLGRASFAPARVTTENG
ncbi:hypothetical protein ACFFQW_40800 [Umezawaea endophytica]|uniref:STAS domain-containing protein n=1 Tax=Umezawaea endophytica TaxID=1654476 RepID=A0A9X3A4J2_9PSEU|nr:hypothetical protein [Umezawaea endophytica]MCS7482879.1 hypothetical protein [Umezawaea endophytica]